MLGPDQGPELVWVGLSAGILLQGRSRRPHLKTQHTRESCEPPPSHGSRRRLTPSFPKNGSTSSATVIYKETIHSLHCTTGSKHSLPTVGKKTMPEKSTLSLSVISSSSRLSAQQSRPRPGQYHLTWFLPTQQVSPAKRPSMTTSQQPGKYHLYTSIQRLRGTEEAAGRHSAHHPYG